MEDSRFQENTEQQQVTAGKSFMTIGPTLHYSHSNVMVFWFLALVTFGMTCSFFSRIVTGSFWSFDFADILSLKNWYLGQFVTSGVSIFEYPWHILIIGLLMGILAVGPVLISQLMCFRYSLLFIVLIVLIANLPGLALFVLIGSFAAATRPLRFRSRFTAIALCLVPQLVYWGWFGGDRAAEPIIWGFSYTPWICAWIVCLVITGLVLGVGHFTRYRPGLVWASTSIILLTAVTVFELWIGFDELDYQLYVAKNNPEQVEQFHNHSLTKLLDDTISDESVIENLLKAYFYPEDRIELRNKLKQEIVNRLIYEDWPWWLDVPEELRFQEKRESLFSQYKEFTDRRPLCRRMPIALYYKAVLSEFTPDIGMVEQKEELSFYNDYPQERARSIWYELYKYFPQSPESIEARWRIAMHWASQGRFSLADGLLLQAQELLPEELELIKEEQTAAESLFGPFKRPTDTAMTALKLNELNIRLGQLRTLISIQNRTSEPQSEQRLAFFVMLNPHSSQYAGRLDNLLGQMTEKDLLIDNVLFARTMLIADDQLRAEKLETLNNDYLNTDGGMQALYELALLKRRFWSQQAQSSEQKKQLLIDTRETMTVYLGLYPDSAYSPQIKKILDDLPQAD